ncbi:hypothetical protein WJX73_000150 [Symbiochloris irregularis]|uniref:Microtubule-associated protein RP/EB family member 1 n=1 Tax=Symbiochloris irregularis TaxID=706552 RepID=A0AAW1PBV3_9CHLO
MSSADGTYFVSKTELLQWLNSTLDLDLTKIEQTASGAVACQLLDAMSPGSVALSKVDFNAVNDYDCINNYKILQAGFSKLNINKPIEVHKLIKARPLDNIEFMQWFKKFFDDRTGGEVLSYDPAARRAASKTGDIKGSKAAGKRTAGSVGVGGSTPLSSRPSASTSAPRRPVEKQLSRGLSSRASTVSDSGVAELSEQVAEMKLKVDNTERERDFYFDKLRDIELLCQMQGLKEVPVVKFFERILYAADDVEAKGVMLEVQNLYSAEASANGHGA